MRKPRRGREETGVTKGWTFNFLPFQCRCPSQTAAATVFSWAPASPENGRWNRKWTNGSSVFQLPSWSQAPSPPPSRRDETSFSSFSSSSSALFTSSQEFWHPPPLLFPFVLSKINVRFLLLSASRGNKGPSAAERRVSVNLAAASLIL